MNINKPIQPGHAASEWNTRHLLAVNIPLTHLPLLTALNTIDAIPAVIQQDESTLTGENARQAASDQQFQQSGQEQAHKVTFIDKQYQKIQVDRTITNDQHWMIAPTP